MRQFCFWIYFLTVFFRQTKPLTFADCIGDELPVGWEEAYDPAVGAYYVDHNTSEFFLSVILNASPLLLNLSVQLSPIFKLYFYPMSFPLALGNSEVFLCIVCHNTECVFGKYNVNCIWELQCKYKSSSSTHFFPCYPLFPQRAPSWRTRGPSGSGSRSPCCGTTWPLPVTRSVPRRRSTRWRSRGSAWRSRSTGSSMMRGGTSRRHRPAVSTVEKQQTWWSLVYFTLRDHFGSEKWG